MKEEKKQLNVWGYICPLSLYLGPIIENVFYKQDAPFLAQDVQRPKLVCPSSYSLLIRTCVTEWNTTFWSDFAQCYSFIPNRVFNTNPENVWLLLQFVIKYFYPIPHHQKLFSSHIRNLNFYYCWCIDMF